MNQSQMGAASLEEALAHEEATQDDHHNNNVHHKALPDMIEEQIIKGFSEELTRVDLEESSKEVEESLKQLTKASLTELKQFAKPHYLVSITLLEMTYVYRSRKQCR